MNYTVGQTVILVGNFTDQFGAPVDPAVVVLSVRSPSGVITTPTTTNTGVGTYEAPVTLTEPGNWWWNWTGTTGGHTAVDEGKVCAEKAAVSV